jgi:hypothetical protein
MDYSIGSEIGAVSPSEEARATLFQDNLSSIFYEIYFLLTVLGSVLIQRIQRQIL